MKRKRFDEPTRLPRSIAAALLLALGLCARTSLGDSRLVFDNRVPPGGPASMNVLAASIDFVF
jgi:hypothetical protein